MTEEGDHGRGQLKTADPAEAGSLDLEVASSA